MIAMQVGSLNYGMGQNLCTFTVLVKMCDNNPLPLKNGNINNIIIIY